MLCCAFEAMPYVYCWHVTSLGPNGRLKLKMDSEVRGTFIGPIMRDHQLSAFARTAKTSTQNVHTPQTQALRLFTHTVTIGSDSHIVFLSQLHTQSISNFIFIITDLSTTNNFYSERHPCLLTSFHTAMFPNKNFSSPLAQSQT